MGIENVGWNPFKRKKRTTSKVEVVESDGRTGIVRRTETNEAGEVVSESEAKVIFTDPSAAYFNR